MLCFIVRGRGRPPVKGRSRADELSESRPRGRSRRPAPKKQKQIRGHGRPPAAGALARGHPSPPCPIERRLAACGAPPPPPPGTCVRGCRPSTSLGSNGGHSRRPAAAASHQGSRSAPADLHSGVVRRARPQPPRQPDLGHDPAAAPPSPQKRAHMARPVRHGAPARKLEAGPGRGRSIPSPAMAVVTHAYMERTHCMHACMHDTPLRARGRHVALQAGIHPGP